MIKKNLKSIIIFAISAAIFTGIMVFALNNEELYYNQNQNQQISGQSTLSEFDFLLDTFVQVTIFYDNRNEEEFYRQVAIDLLSEVSRLESLFSAFEYGTDIYRINNSNLEPVSVSNETIDLLNQSLYIREITNNAFDITMGSLIFLWNEARENGIPPSDIEIYNAMQNINSEIYINGNYVMLLNPYSSIDLGGVAKGYIAWALYEYVSNLDRPVAALVYLGGDAIVIGDKPDGTNWGIGLQNPSGEYQDIFAAISIESGFVAASGIYQRFFEYNERSYHHIINPNTGFPTENGLSSATIISSGNKSFSDAIATAVFVLDLQDAIDFVESLDYTDGIFITISGEMYKTSGIESHENEIKEQRSLIETYKNRSVELKSKISDIDNIIVSIDKKISLVSSYNDGIKYQNILSKTVVDIDKILGPLESAVSDKLQLQYSLKNADEKILSLSKEVKNLETKISEYNRLTSERDELVKKYRDIGLILESVSTKKGIPVRYINKYLGRIRSFANKLLSTIYGDGFELLKFRVTADLFLMPYRAHGQRVPDIRYASQSELPLSTIAISFALMDQMSMYYNIPLLDEIDAGLDDKNKSAFLHMLHKYIEELGVDQTIIISHNLNQISNIPIDVIKLSDVPISSKLQNIIYE